MTVPRPREEFETAAKYLGQFDLHNHTFSHCVNDAHSKPERYWTGSAPNIEDKFHEISERLQKLVSAVEQDARTTQGHRVLAITEHPQFTLYDIPINRYLSKFARESQSPSVKVLWGLEVDLEPLFTKRAFLNEAVLGNDSVGSAEELLEAAQVIVGSMHFFKPWREDLGYKNDRIVPYKESHDQFKSTEEYLGLTLSAIDELGQFKRRVEIQYPGKKRAFIYGHPWGAAWSINKRAYDAGTGTHAMPTRALTRPNFKEAADKVNENMWSSTAQIQFFNPEQLRTISDALLDNGIYLEINRMYTARGQSELHPIWKGITLPEVYIDRARTRNMTPIISICSDAHCADDYGIGDLEAICARIPNINDAKVWAEDF